MQTRSKRIRSGVVSLAKVAARVVLAACLALSFFASLVPLRVSAHDGAMACCAGKAGHCNSGILAKQSAKPAPKPKPKSRPEPEPEPMCGLKPPTGAAKSKAITADAEAARGEEVDAKTISDGITVVATSSEVAGRVAESEAATTSSQPEAIASLHGASLTKPCPADCRAGTTGVVRQPRPREIALLAKHTRGSLPEQASWKPHSLETNLAASATRKCSRPRGPPLPS